MNQQQRAVVQQALEVLKRCQMNEAYRNFEQESHTITALRQLLEAEPVQEPGVIMHPHNGTWSVINPPPKGVDDVALYYAQPASQHSENTAWGGLTDEERMKLYAKMREKNGY
jgi:hypothetical protein